MKVQDQHQTTRRFGAAPRNGCQAIALAIAAGCSSLPLHAQTLDVPYETTTPAAPPGAAVTPAATLPAVQPAPMTRESLPLGGRSGKSGAIDPLQRAAQNTDAMATKPAGNLARADQQGVTGASFFDLAWPMAVVLTLIVGGAMTLKKFAGRGTNLAAALGPGGRAPAGVLEVLGRYPTSRHQSLVLMKLDNRVLLLGQSMPVKGNPGGFSTLCEIASPDEVASILRKVSDAEGTSAQASFHQTLAEIERQPMDRFGNTPHQNASMDRRRATLAGTWAARIRSFMMPLGSGRPTALTATAHTEKSDRTESPPPRPTMRDTREVSPSSVSGHDAAADLRQRLAAMRTPGTTPTANRASARPAQSGGSR